MNYLWVDAGNDPPFGKGMVNLIDGYFLAAFDARTTKAQYQNILNQNPGDPYAIGLYAVSNWPQFEGLAPAQQAAVLVAEYKRLTGGTNPVPKSLRLQWDDERKEPDKIIGVIEAIRAALPNVGLSWTFESRQGGWIGPKLKDNGGVPGEFVRRCIAAKIRYVPQMYNGNMTAVGDALTEDRDLRSRGIPDGLVSPFYDAAKLPYGWQGYAFTGGRLP